MRRIEFVAMLYLVALIGWFIGGSELFVKVRFAMDEDSAVMRSSDPAVARAFRYNPTDYADADVVFETASGDVAVENFPVRPKDLKALASGGSVPLRFRRSHPRDVLYAYEENPSGVGWLLLGLGATVFAVYAHRLLRREAA